MKDSDMTNRTSCLTGCLIGGAIGDSLGLPCENLSARRIRKWWRGEWKQRLLSGYGMFSDDTEHAAMTAHALALHREDVAAFALTLARSIRWWFAAIPAGIGLATAKSCLRLWIGIPPERSGVCSAGNGAAMRAAVIGAFHSANPSFRRLFIEASTRITHRDPRAIDGALWVAEAAACACAGIDGADEVLSLLEPLCSTPVFQERLAAIRDFLGKNATVSEFAGSFGKPGKVSGYAPDTVAVATYAWLRHRHDFPMALAAALACGGDTDTVGAILGGIAGCEAAGRFPAEWKDRIRDWPLDTSKLERLGAALADPTLPVVKPAGCLPSILRNGGFLAVILVHAFRRAFPPY